MVVSHIIGGLGNQMFQYAAGRSLALARALPLRLDVSGFVGYGLHQGFELQRVFCCNAQVATPEDVRKILGWRATPVVRRILARPGLAALRGKAFVVEPHFHYWADICNVPTPCYLMGYWQSERYYVDVEQTIRSDFTFQQPMNGRNQQLAEEISGVNAVSLHVRRGDYANNLRTNATHGLCPPNYYEAAIRYIAERIEAPHFFVFSDDMEWVRCNLPIQFPCTYVDHNRGTESFNDMRLMSLCRHHIIANSTFSWWGAWLNRRTDKIVIAPRRWFNIASFDTRDLYPEGWVLL